MYCGAGEQVQGCRGGGARVRGVYGVARGLWGACYAVGGWVWWGVVRRWGVGWLDARWGGKGGKWRKAMGDWEWGFGGLGERWGGITGKWRAMGDRDWERGFRGEWWKAGGERTREVREKGGVGVGVGVGDVSAAASRENW